MKRFITIICAAALLLSLPAYKASASISGEAAGELFSVSPALFTVPGKINVLIPLSGGRMLVGGSFVSIGGQAAPRSLAIMNSDGSLDPSFTVDPDLQVGEVYAAARQADGKFVISGWFRIAGDPFTYYYLRLNADGTIDDSFYLYAILPGQVFSIFIDGTNILLGGNFTSPTSKIARLDQTGHTDGTFSGVGSGPDGTVRGITKQGSGNYIIVGEFGNVNGTPQAGVARLNANGSLDTTFVPGGSIAGRRVAVLNDNSVVIGGENPCNGNVFKWYNAAGTTEITPSVDPNILESVTAFLPLPTAAGGGLLIGGWRSPSGCYESSPFSHEGEIWRYASDGTYRTMTSFGNESDVSAFGLRSDGKVVVGGQGRPDTAAQIGLFDGLALVDLAYDGLEQVGTFHPLVGDEAEIYSVSLDPTGRLLVAGNFWYANGLPQFGLARLLSNGTLDSTFHPFADQPGGWSKAVVALPDSRVVAGFASSNLFLISAAGALTDLSTYNNFDRVSVLVRQNDGKILVGSDFGKGVRRLMANFSGMDPTFQGGDVYGNVYSIALQIDGRILVAGDFSKYDNITVPGLVRLKNDGVNDGAIDNTFVPPIFLDDVDNAGIFYNVTALGNGKVLVGGYFLKAGGQEHPSLVRLNSNGSLDTGFTSPATFHIVRTTCVQGDASIWTGGVEATFERNPLVKHLTENGSIDSSFGSNYRDAHDNGTVNILLCNSNSPSWAGGRFSLIDNRPYYGLVRYLVFTNKIFLPLLKR